MPDYVGPEHCLDGQTIRWRCNPDDRWAGWQRWDNFAGGWTPAPDQIAEEAERQGLEK